MDYVNDVLWPISAYSAGQLAVTFLLQACTEIQN